MRKDIHPKYEEATITCACGHVLETRSTVKEMHVNTCSSCHPPTSSIRTAFPPSSLYRPCPILSRETAVPVISTE